MQIENKSNEAQHSINQTNVTHKVYIMQSRKHFHQARSKIESVNSGL